MWPIKKLSFGTYTSIFISVNWRRNRIAVKCHANIASVVVFLCFPYLYIQLTVRICGPICTLDGRNYAFRMTHEFFCKVRFFLSSLLVKNPPKCQHYFCT